MKKILLTAAIAAMMAPVAMSQTSFKVSYCPSSELDHFTAIADGDDVEINEIEIVEPQYQYEIPCYLRIDNLTQSALPVEVTLDCDRDATTLDVGDGVQFCNPQSCESTLPATGSGTIEAGGMWGGDASFHIIYYIGGPNNFDPINPDDYIGSWIGNLSVKCGDENFECTIVLTNDGLGGIEGVVSENNAKAEYFNLQGIKVSNPSAGNVYIKRQGSKTTKIRF